MTVDVVWDEVHLVDELVEVGIGGGHEVKVKGMEVMLDLLIILMKLL